LVPTVIQHSNNDESMKHDPSFDPNAEKEKRSAAGNSVLAAVFLTAVKAVVGLSTGSLGILAEAAHSALDLVAALITYVAVRTSNKPADEDHPYGHGKIENFSALVETFLLLVTCAWIIYEAVQRLFSPESAVDASIWAFFCMGISIVVDVSRSRMLYRAAAKHNSQALEADALHFSTDVWSSAVVIGGLALVWVGQNLLPAHTDLLTKADAVAALGVAVIVIGVSYKLGKRTVDVLLDRAPEGLRHEITARVGEIDGVLGAQQVRVRRSGPSIFVDMRVDLARNLPFERTHAITEAVETQIRNLSPNADVIVHAEPCSPERESVVEQIRMIVSRNSLDSHNIQVQESGGRFHVDLHMEVADHLSLREAHDAASLVEQEVRFEIDGISQINIHLEPRTVGVGYGKDVTAQESLLAEKIRKTTDRIIGRTCCHNVRLRRQGDSLAVSLHCTLDDKVSIIHAHQISSHIEIRLQAEMPFLDRILVHAEPEGV
jgi:cation diffusion facilitator family transporter